MGPLAAVDSVFTKYFTLRGRASRAEFWWYSLFQSIGMVAVVAMDIAMFDPDTANMNPFSVILLTTAWMLITFIPNITVAVRRLHDSGKSGMWFFITMVPIVGPALYIMFLVAPSTPDDNIYGQPPHGGARGFGGEGIGGRGASPRKSGGAKASGAMAGYALLNQTQVGKSAEQMAAQKAEVKDYYRQHVLKQTA